MLRQNTCLKCDQFNISVKSASYPGGRGAIEVQRAEHHRSASDARAELRTKTTEAKQPGSKLLVFSFDLQKTQSIPYERTSITFYKRLLWL